ncbi:sarcosine dehydrogenase, mitochondrial [Teleopsis dalmanni]|uniref:sarcosine dehydrogenase, mitochondrial n=1 Tax=Teleopsis dalmanni TaxID=139649 RepID=UPI0018CED7C1|nr:sarcosine dehydrogenase, mitochondrial [Teleopsis dalmanni]
MWKAGKNIFQQVTKQSFRTSTVIPQTTNVRYQATQTETPSPQLPTSADVIIIGGGSAGCHALYHLAKRGVKAVLLERAKLTAGTTWHTAGLVWRLRPNDVDTQLLNNSRNMLLQLEEETGLDPGWIQNGGIFIAHSDTRLDEYRRLATVGNALGIENHVLSPVETQKLFPLLDPKSFIGALYSPGDGVVDPAMLCTALTRAATKNGAKVIENCSVNDLIVESTEKGQKLIGVATPFGNIKTNTVINATGVWGRDLVKKYGSHLPLIPMKHAYIVSESIPGVRGLPNIRDHDYSTYFRIQGDAICMGGYEPNPVLLDEPVPKDFHFGLYDLDWSVFDTHITGATKLCPTYGKYGVKSTVCGPESFTPDHKPLMGPDMNVAGLYHSCGFNSAGMMFGGGCGEQIAQWVLNGKPDLPMFGFDLRRFTANQSKATQWIREKSHESYAKNYSMVFKYDQPLAGRNFQIDPLHTDMLAYNAFMEEKQGWERPGFFLTKPAEVLSYDYYGSYGNQKHKDNVYEHVLEGDLHYGRFSDHHNLIGAEAMACRNNAVVFNMSYFCKLYLEGPQAQKAADWIFTGNTNRDVKKTVYTCALNDCGGVEADVTVSRLESGAGTVLSPKLNGQGHYIVAGGASAYYTYNTILREIQNKGFNATVQDVTADLGVISIQGPKSRQILQKIMNCELSDTNIAPNGTILAKVTDKSGKRQIDVRVLRVSFVGELGYELHVPKEDCSAVYQSLMETGKADDLRNAGYRALYSLSSEKGYHLWSFDLRPDDTPIEAGLGFTCRKNGEYKGKAAIDKQRSEGIRRRLVYLTLKEQVPIWGLEGVYRNGEPIGILRRAEYAYALKKSLGQAYVQTKNNDIIDNKFITSGEYEIDILGKRYKADCHLRSPFDPEGKRILGIYN